MARHPGQGRALRALASFALAILMPVATVAASGPHPADVIAACDARANALLATSELGAFTMFGDGPMAGLGLFELAPLPIDAQFVGGIERTWIATMALSGRYRADNDAYARSLNYPIRSLPLVPLSGLIVDEHPAEPLELYERILVFRDPAWAATWLAIAGRPSVVAGATGNGTFQPQPFVTPLDLGDQAVAVVEPGATTAGRIFAGDIAVLVLVDRTVLSVSARGGPRLRVVQVASLTARALARLERECPS